MLFRTATSVIPTYDVAGEALLYGVVHIKEHPRTDSDVTSSFMTTARAEEKQCTPTAAGPKVGGAK